MTARRRWTLAITALLVAPVIIGIILITFAASGGNRVLPEYEHPSSTGAR
jgi:hypothetical protein